MHRRPPHAPERSSGREAAKAIELFQLAFLEVAVIRLPLSDFALKGGANLRFFFKSQRRSVDIDFNYLGHGFDAFADRVDLVLASRTLNEILRQRDLTLFELRRSKQTSTTRRWKFKLDSSSVKATASKIEFSAREKDRADYEVRPADPELARRLGARSVRLNRYGPIAMIDQKVRALRSRSETQPRDVFDLDLLFRLHPDALAEVPLTRGALEDAIARALSLSYAEYQSTVVAYLDEDFVDVLGSEQAWSDMVLRVTDALERKRAEIV